MQQQSLKDYFKSINSRKTAGIETLLQCQTETGKNTGEGHKRAAQHPGKENRPPVGSMVKKQHAGTGSSKSLGKSSKQMFLDLGQKDFSASKCSVCGMVYAKGHEEDEKLHRSFHQSAVQGLKFQGWAQERVVLSEPFRGRLLMVLPSDPAPHIKRVQEVCAFVEKSHGLSQGWLMSASDCKVFLYVSLAKRVVGLLVVEPIKQAYKVAAQGPVDEEADSQPAAAQQQQQQHMLPALPNVSPAVATAGGIGKQQQMPLQLLQLSGQRQQQQKQQKRPLLWAGLHRSTSSKAAAAAGSAGGAACSGGQLLSEAFPSSFGGGSSAVKADSCPPSLLMAAELMQVNTTTAAATAAGLVTAAAAAAAAEAGVADGDAAPAQDQQPQPQQQLQPMEGVAEQWQQQQPAGQQAGQLQQQGLLLSPRQQLSSSNGSVCLDGGGAASVGQQESHQQPQQHHHQQQQQAMPTAAGSGAAGVGFDGSSGKGSGKSSAKGSGQSSAKGSGSSFMNSFSRGSQGAAAGSGGGGFSGRGISSSAGGGGSSGGSRSRSLLAAAGSAAAGAPQIVADKRRAVRAMLGVRMVWVSSEQRRKGLATKLLDGARCNMVPGYIVPRNQLAFTQPTEEGARLAASFTGTQQFMVYGID